MSVFVERQAEIDRYTQKAIQLENELNDAKVDVDELNEQVEQVNNLVYQETTSYQEADKTERLKQHKLSNEITLLL